MIAGTDEETAVALIREQAAQECHERVMRAAKLAVESFIDYASELKRIRDNRYYLELGFESFDSYTRQYFDISDGQASKYITVLDNKDRLPEELFSPGRRIEISKLYLLTTLDDEDRAEFLSTHGDIEGLSKSEMESEIKELKDRYRKLEEESQVTFDVLETYKTQALDAKTQVDKVKAEREKLQKDYDTLKKTKATLEKRINKLQNAEPVKEYVTVTDETEIKRLKGELEKAEREINGLKTKLENTDKPEAVLKAERDAFRARLEPIADGIRRLMDFVKEHEGCADMDFYRSKIKALRALLGGEENE